MWRWCAWSLWRTRRSGGAWWTSELAARSACAACSARSRLCPLPLSGAAQAAGSWGRKAPAGLPPLQAGRPSTAAAWGFGAAPRPAALAQPTLLRAPGPGAGCPRRTPLWTSAASRWRRCAAMCWSWRTGGGCRVRGPGPRAGAGGRGGVEACGALLIPVGKGRPQRAVPAASSGGGQAPHAGGFLRGAA